MSTSMSRAAPPSFYVSPNTKNHKESCVKFQGSFLFNKPYPKSEPLSSTLQSSFTTLPICSSTKEDYRISDINRKICEFCELGNLNKAVQLLEMSPKMTIESSTYCLMLQLCAELKCLEEGKKVHSFICSSGISIDGLLGTKLVFMYVNCGDIREGRLIFDKIANEKVFLWNFMLNAYAKIGAFEQSVYIFRKMLDLGIAVNSHTLTCSLKCFAALGSVIEGEWIHGYLLKLGFDYHNTVINSLIALYFKTKRVESAVKVFDEMTDRDTVSWNSMISGYVANGRPDQAVHVFNEMQYLGVSFDLVTIVSVLAACTDSSNVLLGRAIHGFAIKARLDQKMTFSNTLLDMYSKCGDLSDAIQVFKEMGEKSVVSWTSLIAGYAREGLSGEAIELFHEMEREGIKPDIFTATTVLHACACSESFENGKAVHDYVRENNMQSDVIVCNSLMDMYAKCGRMENANSVFLNMPIKNAVSWNTMIGGYSKNGLHNEALSLFVAMLQELKPDTTTIACILPACANLAALDRGREIHGYILRNGCFGDRHVANALLDMYVKCGALALARLLFELMTVKDIVSWTVMIAGYGMHGFGKEAIATFNEMKGEGIEPDEISFICILYACSHSGLLDEGWKFFNIMQQEYGIEAKLEHYACVVDLLARTGKLAMAYQFIKSMPIEPDATVWGSLLHGCSTHRDVKLAEKVAEHVFALEPENTGYYVLLANVYSEAEKWEEVRKLRERTGRLGLKKNPGCSWIEVKGKVHIFVAGDSSHPQLQKIESTLSKLRSKMKEEGHYSIQMRYAMINADDLEKEMALCGHSEKLAMVYGILSLPPGKTVRVTKNLRVCGDCHETAKFISKTVGREIVMRDSNRFHHFKDGTCSCRGFW